MADNQTNLKPDGDTVQVPPLSIDDPRSDAAIDDIVAQESDEVLAAEDANIAAQADQDTEQDKQPKAHPVFWFIVAFVAIVALAAGYLLLQPGLSL